MFCVIFRDVIILLVLDGLTSFFAGCVIFVTLGFMAKQSGVHIDDVVAQGLYFSCILCSHKMKAIQKCFCLP